MKQHSYELTVRWGDAEGTKEYRSYSRDHTIGATGKPEIFASSDPAFRGDAARYNPEELLVASLASCHMLWYLHLCTVNGVIVVSYVDLAKGTMEENADGSGRFTRVVLTPAVDLTLESDVDRAVALHERAHHLCFIARSVNFPVEVRPTVNAT